MLPNAFRFYQRSLTLRLRGQKTNLWWHSGMSPSAIYPFVYHCCIQNQLTELSYVYFTFTCVCMRKNILKISLTFFLFKNTLTLLTRVGWEFQGWWSTLDVFWCQIDQSSTHCFELGKHPEKKIGNRYSKVFFKEHFDVFPSKKCCWEHTINWHCQPNVLVHSYNPWCYC